MIQSCDTRTQPFIVKDVDLGINTLRYLVAKLFLEIFYCHHAGNDQDGDARVLVVHRSNLEME